MNIKLNCFKVLLDFVFENFTMDFSSFWTLEFPSFVHGLSFVSLHFAASRVILLFISKRERM